MPEDNQQQDPPEAEQPKPTEGQSTDRSAEIKKLHDEAAEWRRKFRDAEARLKDSEKPPTPAEPPQANTDTDALKERLAKLESELTTAKQEALRQQLRTEFGLTDTMAALLPVDNPDKAREHAEKLKGEVQGLRPTTPALGASNPAGQANPVNPLIEAIKAKSGATSGYSPFGTGGIVQGDTK